MSNRCPPTRGSSSSGWRSLTSIASTGSRRRSRSGRRTAFAIRDRRSGRRPDPRLHALLYAGRPHVLPQLRAGGGARNGRSVAAQLGALAAGTRLLIGFDLPIVATAAAPNTGETVDESRRANRRRGRGGSNGSNGSNGSSGSDGVAVAAALEVLKRKGFGRLLVDGRAVSLDDVDGASLADRPLLQVVVDRVQLGTDDLRQRLTDSIETAYLEGGGAAWAVEVASSHEPLATRPAAKVVQKRSERL